MYSLLPNPNFLSWFLSAIDKARTSIIIVNYLATLDAKDNGPVAKIVEALCSAMKRGVKVQVVLDGSKLGENYLFYRALKDAGADVWMDTSVTFIHTKAILIDDHIHLQLCHGTIRPPILIIGDVPSCNPLFFNHNKTSFLFFWNPLNLFDK